MCATRPQWFIIGRVTFRSPVQEFTQKKPPYAQSKLASCDLLGADGGEIRCSMFGDEVDSFYNVLQPGAVVRVSAAALKPDDRRFSALAHALEISLRKWSRVQVCDDDGSIARQQRYNFVAVADCERLDAKLYADRSFDLVALVRQVQPSYSFNAKASGRPMTKRAIIVSGPSPRSVNCLAGPLFIFFFFLFSLLNALWVGRRSGLWPSRWAAAD